MISEGKRCDHFSSSPFFDLCPLSYASRVRAQSITVRYSAIGTERIDFRRRQTDGNLHNYLIGLIDNNRQVVLCGRRKMVIIVIIINSDVQCSVLLTIFLQFLNELIIMNFFSHSIPDNSVLWREQREKWKNDFEEKNIQCFSRNRCGKCRHVHSVTSLSNYAGSIVHPKLHNKNACVQWHSII